MPTSQERADAPDNQNYLDQTHVMDSSDQMEETDCIPNIFDNAGHTGRVPPLIVRGLDETAMFSSTSNMDVTQGAMCNASSTTSNKEQFSQTLNIQTKTDSTSSLSREETFSNLFAMAGPKKDASSINVQMDSSNASFSDGNMEMTCHFPLVAIDKHMQNSTAAKNLEITCNVPNATTCTELETLGAEELEGVTDGIQHLASANHMEMTCQLPLLNSVENPNNPNLEPIGYAKKADAKFKRDAATILQTEPKIIEKESSLDLSNPIVGKVQDVAHKEFEEDCMNMEITCRLPLITTNTDLENLNAEEKKGVTVEMKHFANENKMEKTSQLPLNNSVEKHCNKNPAASEITNNFVAAYNESAVKACPMEPTLIEKENTSNLSNQSIDMVHKIADKVFEGDFINMEITCGVSLETMNAKLDILDSRKKGGVNASPKHVANANHMEMTCHLPLINSVEKPIEQNLDISETMNSSVTICTNSSSPTEHKKIEEEGSLNFATQGVDIVQETTNKEFDGDCMNMEITCGVPFQTMNTKLEFLDAREKEGVTASTKHLASANEMEMTCHLPLTNSVERPIKQNLDISETLNSSVATCKSPSPAEHRIIEKEGSLNFAKQNIDILHVTANKDLDEDCMNMEITYSVPLTATKTQPEIHFIGKKEEVTVGMENLANATQMQTQCLLPIDNSLEKVSEQKLDGSDIVSRSAETFNETAATTSHTEHKILGERCSQNSLKHSISMVQESDHKKVEGDCNNMEIACSVPITSVTNIESKIINTEEKHLSSTQKLECMVLESEKNDNNETLQTSGPNSFSNNIRVPDYNSPKINEVTSINKSVENSMAHISSHVTARSENSICDGSFEAQYILSPKNPTNLSKEIEVDNNSDSFQIFSTNKIPKIDVVGGPVDKRETCKIPCVAEDVVIERKMSIFEHLLQKQKVNDIVHERYEFEYLQ